MLKIIKKGGFYMEQKAKTKACDVALSCVLEDLVNKKILSSSDLKNIWNYISKVDGKKEFDEKKIEKILAKIGKKAEKLDYSNPGSKELIGTSPKQRYFSEFSESTKIEAVSALESTLNNGRGRSTEDFVRFLINRAKNEEENLKRVEQRENSYKKPQINTIKQDEKESENSKKIVKKDTGFKSDRVIQEDNRVKHVEQRNIKPQFNQAEHEKVDDKISLKDANDIETVQSIIDNETALYEQAIKNSDYTVDLCKVDIASDQKRREYIEKNIYLRVELKNMKELENQFNKDVATEMIVMANRITRLIVTRLEDINLNQQHFSKLHIATLKEPKYNPEILLEQYKELYDKYTKQFNEMSVDDQNEVQRACKILNMKSIPSTKDIISGVNTSLKKTIIKNEIGTELDDGLKLMGNDSLTKYMNMNQIAELKKTITTNRNINATHPSREDEILQRLQLCYCNVLSTKDESNRSLTQICREVLKEEPLFEEPEKKVENKSNTLKDTLTKKITFKSIKEAIARHRADKERE